MTVNEALGVCASETLVPGKRQALRKLARKNLVPVEYSSRTLQLCPVHRRLYRDERALIAIAAEFK